MRFQRSGFYFALSLLLSSVDSDLLNTLFLFMQSLNIQTGRGVSAQLHVLLLWGISLLSDPLVSFQTSVFVCIVCFCVFDVAPPGGDSFSAAADMLIFFFQLAAVFEKQR